MPDGKLLSMDRSGQFWLTSADKKERVAALRFEGEGDVLDDSFSICGAGTFGFKTFWINRTNATPDALGYSPDATLASLSELAHLIRD
jgi:hypothetical protein